MKLLGNTSFIVLLVLGTLAMNLDLCCEIQKVPNLLSHFDEHKAVDGDSFLSFLIEDYIEHGAENKQHNENSHEDLPFHSNHNCSHAPIYLNSISSVSIIDKLYSEVASPSMYNFLFISPSLENPFQPPQG